MASDDRHAQDDQHAHKLRKVLSIASFSAAMSADGGRAARSSIHARLLGSASGVALSVASVVVALGVCVPGAAQAQTTVHTVQMTTFTLTAAQNPIIFDPTTNIDTRGTNTNAVNGNTGPAWTVTNNGTLLGGDTGVLLFEAGSSLTNSKSISGASNIGVELFNGGTVVNQVGGTISGQQSGIDIENNAGTVTNAGTITAQQGFSGSNGIFVFEGGTVNNQAGGTISGDTGIFIGTNAGTVTNAGTITGTGGTSVQFDGTGTNTLTLQTGSVLEGKAIGSTRSGATNNLILEGQGTATNIFQNFHNLDVRANGTWVWNNNSTIGSTTISSGTLAVDGELPSPININSDATLAGKGIVIGTVIANAGATIAPGAAVPFSNLTVNGDVAFRDGSVFKVNVNAARQSDTLTITNGGRADLSGGTVNVLAQSGIYRPSTQYMILSASGGFNNTRFAGVAPTNLAFLTPSLTYDDNNVFLTLTCNPGTNCSSSGGGGGFATVAQTQNQTAVATALNGGAASNPLVIAILNQTADGARQAFDSLSGEVFGSVHNAQAGEMQFARSAMLGRMRQASYNGAAGELAALAFGGPELAYAAGDARAADFPVKAPFRTGGPSRDLTFWAQGLGGWGRTDSDGNAASVTSRFGGFLSGVDAWFGDAARAGFVAGYQRSNLHVDARASSARDRQRSNRRLCGEPPRRLQSARRRLLFVRQHRYQPDHCVPRLYRSDAREISRPCCTGVRRSRLRHDLQPGRSRAARRTRLRAPARRRVFGERRRRSAVWRKCA